jgi:hypothetical protein
LDLEQTAMVFVSGYLVGIITVLAHIIGMGQMDGRNSTALQLGLMCQMGISINMGERMEVFAIEMHRI